MQGPKGFRGDPFKEEGMIRGQDVRERPVFAKNLVLQLVWPKRCVHR